MPTPLPSGSCTAAAPIFRADISRAASRRVWSGPIVSTTVLIASRTRMAATPHPQRSVGMTMVVPVGPRGQAPGRGRRNANRQTAVRIGLGRPRSGAHTGAVTDGSGARPGGATDEIVGGGGPRRRSGAVLFLVAAVLAGYAVSHRGHPPARPQASPPVPAPVLVRQAMRARPGPELSGSVTVGPAGLRVLVDGIEPRIVDAHSLDVTPVPGLRLPKGQAARVLQLGPAGRDDGRRPRARPPGPLAVGAARQRRPAQRHPGRAGRRAVRGRGGGRCRAAVGGPADRGG